MAITKEILDELLKDPSVPISGSVANKPDIRSSMLIDWPNSIITGGCSDQIQSVQMATLSIRDHPSLRSLVFTLRPQLSRPRSLATPIPPLECVLVAVPVVEQSSDPAFDVWLRHADKLRFASVTSTVTGAFHSKRSWKARSQRCCASAHVWN